MKLVVQRVRSAKVTRMEDGRIVGKIGKGFLVLIGIKKGDTENGAKILAMKLSKLRVMADEKNKMNLSIKDIGGEVLVVSQFTLYADTSTGNRPSFIKAEDPSRADALYKFFIDQLKNLDIRVETGSFGNEMKIDTVLDGPVTIIYD